jgi:hypothetical protein
MYEYVRTSSRYRQQTHTKQNLNFFNLLWSKTTFHDDDDDTNDDVTTTSIESTFFFFFLIIFLSHTSTTTTKPEHTSKDILHNIFGYSRLLGTSIQTKYCNWYVFQVAVTVAVSVAVAVEDTVSFVTTFSP